MGYLLGKNNLRDQRPHFNVINIVICTKKWFWCPIHRVSSSLWFTKISIMTTSSLNNGNCNASNYIGAIC